MPSVFPTIQGANLNEDESSGDCDYVCWNSLGSASHSATANPTRRPSADANCAPGPDANLTLSTNHRAGTDASGAGSTAADRSSRPDQRPGSFPGSVS